MRGDDRTGATMETTLPTVRSRPGELERPDLSEGAPTIGEVSTTPLAAGAPGPAAADPAGSSADDTAARITRILDERRRLLPGIRAEVARWQTVDEQLAALAAGVESLRTHATTPAELRD